MGIGEAIGIVAAGIAAGAINTMVGSGTLISFPVLLGFGYSPVLANVSNKVGLVPGAFAGAFGYRRELEGQGRRTTRLAVASLLGGTTGAVLLLELPESAFHTIAPAFIVIALLLVVFQPRLARALAARRAAAPENGGVLVLVGLYLIGVYGGYFGAAQGVLMLAVLGLGLREGLQRINAVKNVLGSVTNLIAAAIFIGVATVAWGPALLLGGGSVVGGLLGARVGRRLPPTALRGLIVVVGCIAIVKLVV